MIPVQVNVDRRQFEFLQQFNQYGFIDESEVVRAALMRFQESLQAKQLEESADLYRELYLKDTEMQDWTEAATLEPLS